MKKLSIKLSAFLLAAVMALTFAFPSVLAENETIDTSKTGSLTITKTNSINTGTAENPVYSKIAGAIYTLYKVAKIEQKTDNGVVTTIYTPLYNTNTVTHLPASITAIDEVNSKNFNDDAIDELDNLTSLTNSSSSGNQLTKYTAYYEDGIGSNSATQTVDGYGTAQFGINTTYTLESGYVYLAVETKTPDGAFQSNNFLVTVPMYDSDSGEWDYDIEAEPKNDLASVVKSVKTSTGTTEDLNNTETVETVKAGDIVQYQLVVTLPKNFSGANYTNYTIVDKPGTGLIHLDNSSTYPVVVEYYAGTDISGTGTTLYSTSSTSTPKGYEYSFNAYDNQMSFELIDTSNAPTSYAPYYNGYSTSDVSTLVITYYAKIAAISDNDDGSINNSINLDINDNTYEPGGGSLDVYSYDYRLWKTDDKNIDANAYTGLPGAQFILSTSEDTDYLMLVTYQVNIDDPDQPGSYKTVTMTEWLTSSDNAENVAALNGTQGPETIDGEPRNVTYKTVFDTDANGLAKVEGLSFGTYYLTEVKAPSYSITGGDSYEFTLLTSPVKITISSSSNTNANTTVQNSSVISDNWTDQIVNKLTSSWQLPSTGDMGIMLFIIVGALLAITAIILIKRTSKKDGEGNKV
ncbi:MAG: SpaH/EbpB family LPXTG-anchored major pilin [Lachnospiraceae bacterium]